MPKIERKYLAHYINTAPGETSAVYEILGKDLEELNVELNAEVESKKNILGETSVNVSSYEAQASAGEPPLAKSRFVPAPLLVSGSSNIRRRRRYPFKTCTFLTHASG